ncbi:unnamed protein product [marine sediment metagenome]|uniref:Transglutaminase-like domain-containing protein n=1 Tax=marine sediment metagenome TaxID=412755 RepID=X0TXU9_9ZZZZ
MIVIPIQIFGDIMLSKIQNDSINKNVLMYIKYLHNITFHLLIYFLAVSNVLLGDQKVNKTKCNMVIVLKDYQKKMLDEYIERLQDYPKFDTGEKFNNLPKWEYCKPDAPSLSKLSNEYNLKDVAGSGTEIEKMLNLMDWVHRVTSSKGEIGNPEVLNAPSIIEFVRSKGLSVNCKMKSIVLNEILLSFGYHSRRISLKPSKFDGDSHSIVMVFSNTHKKWICLDPTFNTYFHNDSGEILGYIEIREIYRKGEIPKFRPIQFTIRPPLMLAGKRFDSYDEWYAVYMAKNCFQAASPQKSAFGYESSESTNWILLLPSNFQSDEIGRVNTYITHNPEYFFQEP